MFMIVSWVFLFSMLIKKIVWEKEKKLTQTLRVMGVGKAPHWIAWFLDAFIPMIFVSFFLAIILVVSLEFFILLKLFYPKFFPVWPHYGIHQFFRHLDISYCVYIANNHAGIFSFNVF